MSATKENVDYDREAAIATLSPEELEAINSPDLSEDEVEILREVAGESSQEEAEPEAEETEKDAAEGDAKDGVEASSAEERKEAKKSETNEVPELPDAPIDVPIEEVEEETGPVYKASVPDDLNEKLKDLENRADDLAKKLKDGEIEIDDFIAQTRKISDERAELEALRVEARLTEQINRQNAEYQWQRTVKSFLREVKAKEGIDYLSDQDKASKLDAFVKALASEPTNADKPMRWFLEQAHKAAKAVLGIQDREPPAKAQKEQPANRRAPVKEIPKTLAHVPGGDGPGDVADEFAELDKLTGEAYEAALARLTPAQRERYLSAV